MRTVAIFFVGVSSLVSGCTGGDEQVDARAGSTVRTATGDTPGSTVASDSTTTSEAEPVDETAVIQTPSRNIHCDTWVDPEMKSFAEMRCHIKEISGPEIPRPSWAMCDWNGGRDFSLTERGPGRRASFCDALPREPGRTFTIGYGAVWRYGPFTCLSSRLGLLCTNPPGHGLFLSRERQQGF
ncbi:MAG: hypothetical protein M3301_02225 [Chloroflexota bacterium]|nr:hypothetical protein [Chloroflexota bacterium]